jgi:hypothetical protein
LPTAVTSWPTFAFDELPGVIGWRRDAPFSCNTATSLVTL